MTVQLLLFQFWGPCYIGTVVLYHLRYCFHVRVPSAENVLSAIKPEFHIACQENDSRLYISL